MSQHVQTIQGCPDYNHGRPLLTWSVLNALKNIRAIDAALWRSLAYFGLAAFLAVSAAVLLG